MFGLDEWEFFKVLVWYVCKDGNFYDVFGIEFDVSDDVLKCYYCCEV